MSTASVATWQSPRGWSRFTQWIAGGAAVALAGGLLVAVGVVAPASANEPSPVVGVHPEKSFVLGEDLPVGVTIDNPDDSRAIYNLSVSALLPANALVQESPRLGAPTTYGPGSTVPNVSGEPCVDYGLAADTATTCAVPADKQYLVFENISNLPARGSLSETLIVRPLASNEADTIADAWQVGDEFKVSVNAFTSANNRLNPVFPGSTGAGTQEAKDATSGRGIGEETAVVRALRIEKIEPSPESELLRGVHTNTTTYTLRVHHTAQGTVGDTEVVDYLPAGLEYLGTAGGVDYTTNANGTQGGAPEYPGAPLLTATPAPEGDQASNSGVEAEQSVETVTLDAAQAAELGLAPGVYTKVTWNLGDLLAADPRNIGATQAVQPTDLSAAGTAGFVEIRYRAGVPLFENTMDFGRGAPSPESLEQTANLDNNRGPSTRHGMPAGTPAEYYGPGADPTAAEATTWTNGATASGTWREALVPGSADTATESVDAVDVRLLKSVRIGEFGLNLTDGWSGSASFEQGKIADYRLALRTSEYVTAVMDQRRPDRLVDDLANGLCPVYPATVKFEDGVLQENAPNFLLGDPNTMGSERNYLSVSAYNAALQAAGLAECQWGTDFTDPNAQWSGATLLGIAFDPATGHFYQDLQINPATALAAANAEINVIYSAIQNSRYLDSGAEDGATSSGDTVPNTAETLFTTTPVTVTTENNQASVGGEFWAWDDSQASVTASYSEMTKWTLAHDKYADGVPTADEVVAMDYPTHSGGTGTADPATWTKNEQTPFAIGDQVWYKIHWEPSHGADVRNPVITDTLPPGVAFDASLLNASNPYEDSQNYRVYATNAGEKLTGNLELGRCAFNMSDPAGVLAANRLFIPANPVVDDTRLQWELGTADCFTDTPSASADRFWPERIHLDIYLRVTVTDATAFASAVDHPENLADYQQENVDGDLFFLRDKAAITLDSTPRLVKGIADNTYDGAPAATTGAGVNSNVDGDTAVQQDEIRFRIDVTAPSSVTSSYQVWDALPEGVLAADLKGYASASHAFESSAHLFEAGTVGGPVAHSALAYDWADLPEAVKGDISDAYQGRSIVVWNVSGTVPGSERGDAAVDPAVPAVERGATLEYTVTVPASGERAALIGQRYVNTASIAQFDVTSNTNATTTVVPTLPSGASTVPTGGSALAGSGNKPGQTAAPVSERTAAEGQVAVDANAMTDPSDFVIPRATMAKTLVATEIAPTGTTVTDTNNTSRASGDVATRPNDVIVQGEYATFDYSVTVPANTTVRGGVLADLQTLVRQSGGAMSPATARYQLHSAALQSSPAGVTVNTVTGSDPGPAADSVTFGFRSDTGKLVFPEYYTTDDTADTFTVRIVVWMQDLDASHTGAGTEDRPSIANETWLRNTASFASQNADGEDAAPLRATADVQYREPNLRIAKTASPDTAVQAGQTITYTLSVTNSGRVKSYDNTVVDTVPAGLLIDTAPLVAAGATFAPNAAALQTGLGGTITWSPAQFAELREIPATATLSYTAQIDPSTGAGTNYVNTARVTGYTLPGTLAAAESRRGDRTATSSETITATTAAIEKGVRVSGSTSAYGASASAPIGETVQYRVPITLNPNINYYDVRVQDQLPAGVTMNASTIRVQQIIGGGSAVDVTGDWAHSTSGQTHTWAYTPTGGDLLANTSPRTLVFTYDVLLSPAVAANVTALTNTASFAWARVNGGGLGTPITDTATVTVLNPALQIEKTVDGVDAITRNPDAEFDYALTVSQAPNGNTPAHIITVRDAVPAGVKVDVDSIEPVPSSTTPGVATGAGGTITWQLAGPLHQQAGAGTPKSIALSYSASFVASASLTAAALTNTANVTHFESFGSGGRSYDPPLTGTGSIRDTAQVTPLFPNVVPTKSVTSPVAGQSYGLAYVDAPFNWTLSLRNSGAGVAQDITVTDTLPENWEYVGAPKISVDGGAPVDFVAPTIATDGNVQTLVWNAKQLSDAAATPLAASGTVVVTFDARPVAAAHTTPGVGIEVHAHTNTLGVTATDTQGSERNASGDYAGDDSTATAYLGSADLKLVKEAVGGDADGKWIAGQSVGGGYAQPQWRITATNHGPDASFGPFAFEDTTRLPSGVTTGAFTARYYAGAGDTTGTVLSLTGLGTSASPFVVGDRTTSLKADGTDRIVLIADVAVAADADVTSDAENVASVLGRTYEPADKIPAEPGNPNPNSDEAAQPLTSLADLAITKIVTNVETPRVGGTVSWQLQLRNLGPSVSVSTSANPITISDTVPANISGVADPSNAGWVATLNGAAWAPGTLAAAGDLITLTYVGDAMPVGLGTAINLTGTIATSHTGTLTNSAEIEPGETTDPVDPNNTDEVTITPDDSTEVRIAKTRVVSDGAGGWVASTTPIVPGDPVSYQITVINDGPADARNVTVVDEVPVGLTYSAHANIEGTWSFAAGGTSSEGTDPLWNTFTLAGTQVAGSDAATSFVVTYNTDSALITGTSVIENWAEVDADNDENFDPSVQRDNDRSDSTRVVDLGIVKTHVGTGPFDAGTVVTYSLVVTNHGPSNTNGPIVVADALPAGMSYVAESATFQVDTGTAIAREPALSGTGNRTLTWSLLSAAEPVAAGSTITVTFDALIDASVQPQALENEARVSGPDPDDNPGNDRDDDEVRTTTLADMVLDKQVEVGPWIAGTEVEYSITVRNDGPSAANARVVDTLPAGLTLVRVTGTTGWDCAASVVASQVATCDYLLHPVGAGATSTITVVAALAPNVADGTTLENVAELSWSDRRGPHELEDTAEIEVSAIADLGLAKTAIDADGVEISTVTPGTESLYRFEVDNFGPSNAVGPLTITDTLPVGVTFVAVQGTDWSATPGTVVPGTGQQVTFTHATGLAAGTAAPDLVISVFVDATVADGASLVNTATVRSETAEPDPDPHPNTDDAAVTAERAVDLAIEKSHAEEDVRIGDELPFTLRVENLGPSQATGVTVTDTVPAGLEVLSGLGPVLDENDLPTGWTIDAVTLAVPGDSTVDPAIPTDPAGGATVIATYAAPLAPGEEAEPLVLVTRVTAAAYNTVTNVADVSGTEPDTDPGNNRAEDPVIVPPMVTLVTEKTAVGQFKVGEVGTYRITIENQGPTEDPGPVTVTDALPAGLTYAGSPDLPAGVSVAVSGTTVTWTIAGGLAASESVELQLRVNVAQAAYPSVTNVVTVDSPAEKTPESVLNDDATAPVTAADPLVVTGGDLATGLLAGMVLMLLLGAAAYRRGRRSQGAHAA